MILLLLTSMRWNLNVVLNCINMMVNVSTGLQFLPSTTPTVEQVLSCPVLCLVLHDITKVVLGMLLQKLLLLLYPVFSKSPIIWRNH